LPSDIIHSYSGTSIEIIDTDAEGRLVLADGISYMNYKPEYIIYYLTGSSVGTLVMNVALCLPIMKPSKTTRCRRFSRSAYGNYRFGMSINKI
jgi:hypothetical protein